MCFLMNALLVHHFHVYIAIIHGYYNSKNYYFLSVTCNGAAETKCLTCNGAKHRTWNSVEGKCPCDS